MAYKRNQATQAYNPARAIARWEWEGGAPQEGSLSMGRAIGPKQQKKAAAADKERNGKKKRSRA
jgi:hypothetical protein